MKFFDGHLNVTPKSVGAAVVGIVTMASAFHWLTTEQASAVTTVVMSVLAIVVPDREQGA